MKRIEVIIPDSGKSKIMRALEQMNLHFTQHDSKGHGRTPPSIVEFDRGTSTIKEELSKNVTIITVVSDSIADKVIENVLDNVDSTTEGKIFVYEVTDAIDIRTKKRGDSIL